MSIPQCPTCARSLSLEHRRTNRQYGRAVCVDCGWKGEWFAFLNLRFPQHGAARRQKRAT